MKKRIVLAVLLCAMLFGCAPQKSHVQVLATTLPVYEFTEALCQNTGIRVGRLISEPVSCLHDYSLSVAQVRAVEQAELVIQSGVGLEDFLGDLLQEKQVIDSGAGVSLLECSQEHDHSHDHNHEADAHIWLSPENAVIMAKNICTGLTEQYPHNAERFASNLEQLLVQIAALETYGKEQLKELNSRKLITFHDGFSYFAQAFDLTILKAIEEESGSEASAQELAELITLAKAHGVTAIFTEKNASASAAEVVVREIDGRCYALDMAMAGDSWFDSMYHNIRVIKEALG